MARGLKEKLFNRVMESIEKNWEEEIEFLRTIARYPSTLGNESALQDFMANYFKTDLGLITDKFVPDLKKLSSLPGYSPVEWTYTGRPVVVGKWEATGQKTGKSLILQGHIDVVSPEPISLWNYDPWGATIVGNRMYGRGVLDMKAGIAAMIFAFRAIKESNVSLAADLFIETVIEEECTGNGALATLDRGYIADGALIPEPFGLRAVIAQPGVIWMRVRVLGLGAHVERADRAVNAIEKAYVVIQALKEYEDFINSRPKHPDFENIPHPLNVNVGIIHAGDWPSKVPAECVLEVRIGFYPGQDPNKIKEEVKDWLLRAANEDEWLSVVKPEITFYGFHAEGVSLNRDQELFHILKKAHHLTCGTELEYCTITATTDIRHYNLYYNIPATCYGPVGENMHGADEWVDLTSVKQVTKTYAAFIMEWCGISFD